jgi:hypothetical protein
MDRVLNWYHADELRKLRKHPHEFHRKMKDLEGKYSKARVNKIVKQMKSEG